MRIPLTLAVTLAVVIGALAPAVAVPAAALGSGDVRAPLADAGLDQQVDQGTTVHLDATGSRDLDGSIAHYEWVLTTPTGATQLPAGFTNPQTTFVPTQPGRWEATLHVTDAAGHTSTDTLYIYVDRGVTGPPSSGPPSTAPPSTAPPSAGPPSAGSPSSGPSTGFSSGSAMGADGNAPPRVQIIGPSVVPPGESVRYEARAVDPDGAIVSRDWVQVTAGGLRGGVGVRGSGASISRYFSARDSGRTVTLTVSVEDNDGAGATATKRVRVRTPDRVPPLAIVGPDRLRSGETGSWSIRTFEGNFETYSWNIDRGRIGDTSASASWEVPNGSSTRTVVVRVSGHRENGTIEQASKSVTIERPIQFAATTFTTREIELDLSDKRGVSGVINGAFEYLFWEDSQACRAGDNGCVVGNDPGRMNDLSMDELAEAWTETESEGPNTADLLVDDFDGGVVYDASMDLYDEASELDGRGDNLDRSLTRLGSRFGERADDRAAQFEEAGESEGQSADQIVGKAGRVTGRVVHDTYEESGEAAGIGAATAIRVAGGSEVQAEKVGKAVEQGIGLIGDNQRDGIESVSDAAGDGAQTGVRAGGYATGQGVKFVGDGGEAVANMIGDVAESGLGAGARVAETVGDAGIVAGHLAHDFLPDDEESQQGEDVDDDSTEGSGNGWLPFI